MILNLVNDSGENESNLHEEVVRGGVEEDKTDEVEIVVDAVKTGRDNVEQENTSVPGNDKDDAPSDPDNADNNVWPIDRVDEGEEAVVLEVDEAAKEELGELSDEDHGDGVVAIGQGAVGARLH